jgi:MraZ protein
MSHFLGTHQNRLDAKGRTSVPAPFRSALRALSNGESSLILRPSHQHACIEAWPIPAFEALATPLDQLDVFSQAYDDLAASLYADAVQVEADKEGRIILPESLVHRANITDVVAFVGMGRIFQIWEPAAAARWREESRARTKMRDPTVSKAA